MACVLSIDIGIRNLAMCIMSTDDKKDISKYKIELWDTYDTLENDEYLCESLQKNGKICAKKCGYKYNKIDKEVKSQIFCCKTHFPKTIKIGKEHIFKKKLIDSYLLQDIANIVLLRMDNIYEINKEIFCKVDQILIELQPSMARKMIFTSHLIYGKLIELYRNTKTTIRFVRASQKLKAYTGPIIECKLKGAYAKRKWLSIQYTRWFLENKFSKEEKEKWLPIFLTAGKSDDRSDCLLMDLNGLLGIPKKQKYQKNGKCIK